MSSVQDIKKCPQCQGVYITDFNCRTQEEARYCQRCGRAEEWFLIRDNDNKLILNEDGQPKMEYKLQQGFGSIKIAFKDVAQILHLGEPVTKEIEQYFLESLDKPEVIKEKCYLTSWDPEKNELTALYGTMPESYDEFMKEWD